MGISKPSQSWAKHQKDMAVLYFLLDVIVETARTGKIGDGKIFVTDIERIIRIRTGEENEEAV